MIGGDSSIYSWDGVGGTPRGIAASEPGIRKRHGEPKLPRKVVACSCCFSVGLLFLLSAQSASSPELVDDSQNRE